MLDAHHGHERRHFVKFTNEDWLRCLTPKKSVDDADLF